MAKKTGVEFVPVTVRIPKIVHVFLRKQFAPFEEDVMSEYQAAFIYSVEQMLRDDFPKVPMEVWFSLKKSGIPIPVSAQMRKALEEAAKDRGVSIDALVQQIISEKMGKKVKGDSEEATA